MLTRLLELATFSMEQLGLTWAMVVSGFCGSLLSLISIDPAAATLRVRLSTIGGGVALSWFGTPAIGNYWDITHVQVLAGISLVLGIYGLAIVKETFDFIKSGSLRALILTVLKLKGSEK